jgi:AraC-like DNA-binding protein
MKLALDFLLITGILFTGLLLIFLIRNKKKEAHQKILICIFLLIFFVFISYYAYLHRIRPLFYATFIFSDSTDVFIGPLLFVYVKGIIEDAKNSLRDNIIHFIFPTLYVIGISIPAVIAMIVETYTMEYLEKLQPILLFTIVYSYVYCIITYFKLLRLRKLVKFNYSNLENKDLNWVRLMLLASIVILTIDISTSIYESFEGDMGIDIGFITVIPIVFMILYLGYYGTIQSTVLIPDFLKEFKFDEPSSLSKLNKQSSSYSYNQKEMSGLSIRLNKIMTEKKPFLDEDLTLTNLATILEVPDKKLSTLLSQNMKTSFYDYVNGFRVAEVIKMMSSTNSDKFKLLAIAFDCGFNSKSSFNRIFKKVTELSPSAYRKQVKIIDK